MNYYYFLAPFLPFALALFVTVVPSIVIFLLLKWGGLAVTEGEQEKRWKQIIKDDGFNMTITIGLALSMIIGIVSLAAQAHPSLLCVSGVFIAGYIMMLSRTREAHSDSIIQGWMLSFLMVAAGITLLILTAAALAQFSAMDRFN